MWEPPPVVRDELYHVKHPPLAMLGKLKVVKSLHPWPAASRVWPYKHGNSSPMEEYVLEWFIDTQTSRCSREHRRLLFIWRAGVSTSPLQLLAYKGFLPLKGFWVYVQAYGITLSSVLTAKHDSTANFWPEIKLQQNDKKQTSNLLGYYQTGVAGVLDEGNKVI